MWLGKGTNEEKESVTGQPDAARRRERGCSRADLRRAISLPSSSIEKIGCWLSDTSLPAAKSADEARCWASIRQSLLLSPYGERAATLPPVRSILAIRSGKRILKSASPEAAMTCSLPPPHSVPQRTEDMPSPSAFVMTSMRERAASKAETKNDDAMERDMHENDASSTLFPADGSRPWNMTGLFPIMQYEAPSSISEENPAFSSGGQESRKAFSSI